MKLKVKIQFLIIALLGAFACVNAQEVDFTMSAPKLLKVGEQFQLVLTINAKPNEITPPAFNDFQYLGGPMQGSSTNMSIVNGKRTTSSTYTFTYYLRANAPGVYTISSASAKIKSDTYVSNAVKIEVVGSNQQAQPQQQQGQSGQSSAEQTKSGGEASFVRLHLDKKEAYIGEQVTGWIKIYTNESITGVDQQFKGPDYIGFYKQDVDIPDLRELTREKVGNQIYNSGMIKKVILYPQKSGEITIQPFDLNIEIRTMVRQQSQSIFDDFFGTPYKSQQKTLKSRPVKIKIKPLPTAGKPKDYSGAVGDFKMKTSVSATDVTTNDALTFKINISGTGNVKLLEKVATSFPAGFEVFDPVIKTSIDNNNSGRSGTKYFEYTVIPRHAGTFEVEPFKFSYFNSRLGKYQTLSSQGYTINVAKGEGDTTTYNVVSGVSKREIELLGTDIDYLQTNTKLTTKASFIFGSKTMLFYYLGLVVGLMLLIVLRYKQIKDNANVAKMANKKANKQAIKRLKKAQTILTKENNTEGFYEELVKAILGYISDKIGMSAVDLSKDKISQELLNKAVPQEIISEYSQLVDECEFARYAPSAASSEPKALYKRAYEVITKIDQNIKA